MATTLITSRAPDNEGRDDADLHGDVLQALMLTLVRLTERELAEPAT